MEITIGSRKVTKTLRSWSEGGIEKAFAEFIDKRDQSRMLCGWFLLLRKSEVKLYRRAESDTIDQGGFSEIIGWRKVISGFKNGHPIAHIE
jgi:hypothetical protein